MSDRRARHRGWDLAAMRPLTLHQVWVGDAPIPERLRDCAASWRRFNPRMRLILWTDEPRPRLGAGGPWHEVRTIDYLCNADLYARVHEWTGEREAVAARADIIRMEVVARHGGIYADLDVRCFRAVEHLLRGVRLFCADEWGPAPGNYLFGAVPNHPATWTAVRELRYSFWRYTARPRRSWVRRWLDRMAWRVPGELPPAEPKPVPVRVNPVELCGPRYLNDRLRTHPDLVLFPYQLFNPLSPWEDPAQVEVWPAATHANHEYAGTWYDRVKGRPSPEFLLEGGDAGA